jgi:hypothetical protein
MKKDETFTVFVGDKKIGETKAHTIKLPDTKPSNGEIMQFYYRRGNKYFFKGIKSKLMVETLSIKDKLKRGEYFNVEIG